MPAKLDRCVRKVMQQGYDEDSAWAICRAALNNQDPPAGTTNEVMNIARRALSINNRATTNRLATHQATATLLRRTTFEGREHLVAPVVAIREGVLNGELVPAEEIGRFVDAWNGIPLPIDHPMDRGVPISANRPDLIETRSVGRFWNASFDGKALRGELWIDVEKARNLGGDALKALEKLERGEPLEVSTAYFNDLEPVSGTFNGQRYSGIQRNLRPDHLALLPNGVGACSWADGCGAPRVNKGGEARGMKASMKELPKKLLHFVQNALGINAENLSHSDLERRLKAALQERTEWVFIHDVFDDYVVYDDQPPDKPARLLKRGYTIDENNVITLSDEYEEVIKVTRYEPVRPTGNAAENTKAEGGKGNKEATVNAGGGSNKEATANTGSKKTKGEGNMKKTELVNRLIANSATRFTENDREWLESLTEEQLKKLEPVTPNKEQEKDNPAANAQSGETPCDKVKANQQADSPKTNAGEEKKPKTLEEWINEIPDEETRDFIINSRKKQQEHRQKLIKDLSANERCAFTEDELKAMKTNQLEKLAQSLKPEDYSGIGGPRTNMSKNDDDEIPAPPPVILAKNEDKEAK